MPKRSAGTILILTVLLFAGSFTIVGAQDKIDLPITPYNPEKAIQLAQLMDRPLMFSFMAKGCTYCINFKEKTLTDSRVAEIINSHFIFSVISTEDALGGDSPVVVNWPGYGKITLDDLALRTGFQGTPHSVLITPDLTGLPFPVQGYRKPDYLIGSLIYFGQDIETRGESFWRSYANKSTPEINHEQFHNYNNKIKLITKEQEQLLGNTDFKFPTFTDPQAVDIPSGVHEIILDFSDEERARELADQLLAEDKVEKVYIVKPTATD